MLGELSDLFEERLCECAFNKQIHIPNVKMEAIPFILSKLIWRVDHAQIGSYIEIKLYTV